MTVNNKIKAKISGIDVEVKQGTTVLEAAKKVHVGIPTLCKHSDLDFTAGCGICVVKMRDSGNIFRACCTPLQEGMDIITQDPELISIRRTILELILSNHPDDCLTCGRNNNCELQSLASDFGIREESFEKRLRDLPADNSTKAIELVPEKCILCGRCVQVCQQLQDVWALSFLERGFYTRISSSGDIELAESPCIKCGQCSAHCPTGAIFEYDETRKVWDALMDPEKHCVAQIAPAVRVGIGEEFYYPPGTNLAKKLYALLKRLGFQGVFDTSFGADVTIMEEATEFKEKFQNNKARLPLITTCCPSWVNYMEKYYPDMIEHFSSCKSPHQILGVLSKTYYAKQKGIDPEDIYMVSIMPCTSKKYEITRSEEMSASGHPDVDVVLTTRELARMIRQADIRFKHLPGEEPDHILGEYTGAGVIFGATGGVMEAALRTSHKFITGKNLKQVEIKEVRGLKGVKEANIDIDGTQVRAAIAHGIGNVETVIERVKEAKAAGRETPYHFIEVMACPGGCIGGGGQPYGVDDKLREERARGLYNDDKEHKIRYSHENPYVKKLYEEFLDKPLGKKSEKLLHNEYKARPVYKK
ncbi:MAG: NADH-dependent [FeFe] hydrogenase, group A6 [Elusimicrobiota bacterium]